MESFLKGGKVTTADLRIDLRQELGSGFDPKSINFRLLDPDGVTPRLLGIWHVDHDNPLIGLTDRVITFIRDEVLPTKAKSLSAARAAERLKRSEREIRLVFMLLQSVGLFWDAASGMPTDGIGYQEIQFKSDNVIEAYLAYTGLENAISEKQQRDSELASKLQAQRTDASTIMALRTIYDSPSTIATYVGQNRLEELREIRSQEFDLKRLIRLIEELNLAYTQECYMSVAMLVRAILDHVPPIFRAQTFTEVANNYSWDKSHKKQMHLLDGSLRNVANAHLHIRIRKKEVLPDQTQVDFRAPLDVLLAEIVRVLKLEKA